MKCGNCQKKLDDPNDVLYFDNEGFVFCSEPCKKRGFNLNSFLSNITQNLKGWKHSKAFHRTFDQLFMNESEQKVYDLTVELFKAFTFNENISIVVLSKEILKTIHKTKKMTNKQKKTLCLFAAEIREGNFIIDKKIA
jgi:hypothetical protein